jgi:hypothetical protein
MTAYGPTRTFGDVRFRAAVEGRADIEPAFRAAFCFVTPSCVLGLTTCRRRVLKSAYLGDPPVQARG